MNARTLAGLIALNAVLLAALVVSLGTPEPAEAQLRGGRDFTMIPGQATGRDSQSVIYLIDANSGEMISVFFNSNNNQFTLLGQRDVASDMIQQ